MLSGLRQLYCLNNIFEMLEHSSNNSSGSNLFALSSESELSDLKKSKKYTYSAFVRKVKHLLQAEGDDLEELYRKVEIIVKKYFNEHKIVEFGDMYNHIIALKSNSKKMTKIVNTLEKRLLQEQTSKSKSPTEGKNSDRLDEFEVTSSTQKDSKKNKEPKEARPHTGAPILVTDHIKENTDRVISSMKSSQAMRPKKKQPDNSPVARNNKPEYSPSRYSPGKLNSSFEQYQIRNKQYEDKVRELMIELKDIKASLQNQPSHREEDSFERIDLAKDIKEELKIRLDGSQFQEEPDRFYRMKTEEITYERDQPAMNDTSKNRMSSTKQSESLSINHASLNIQIKPEKIVEKEKSNVSSVQTIGDHALCLEEEKQKRDKPQQKQQVENKKKSVLLEQANSITKQIQELRQVATMLQIESTSHIQTHQSIPKPEDQASVLSQDTKIYELTRPESKNNVTRPESREQEHERQDENSTNNYNNPTNKRQILERISNASSKVHPTEEMIPSFKNIQDSKGPNLQTSIIPGEPSFKRVDDSSIFSFSNTRIAPHLIETTQTGSYTQQHAREFNSNVRRAPPHHVPMNLAVSTVRRGFNPYPQVQPPPIIHHPQVRFEAERPSRHNYINNRNQSSVLSPKNNNQFTVTLSRSQIPSQKAQGIRISSRQKPSSQKNRYSHLRQAQNERSSSRTKVRFVSPSLTFENPSSTSHNSSKSSMGRRGMNVMSPPPAMY